MDATRAEVCVVACAEAWRGDGEILASPIGLIPTLGARLARRTFAPELLLTDGEAHLVTDDGEIEGWMPYRAVLDLVPTGKRHVMMGASQLDRYGNQNISRIGPADRPTRQLLGARGAPGNSVCHPTSYWVPRHSRRVFVERVDMICGVGTEQLRRVVTDLAVLERVDGELRLASIHPGVTAEDVTAATGFPLPGADGVPPTRWPTTEELKLLREVLDPAGKREK